MHIGYWWESQKEKKTLGRPRRRWMDNIRMDLRKIGWDDVDWIDMAQDRDQWRAAQLAAPQEGLSSVRK
jgi:hypothetical protein